MNYINGITNRKEADTHIGQFAKGGGIRMNLLQIRSWLHALNCEVEVSNLEKMSESEIEKYADELYQMNYTFEDSKASWIYILWGKRIDFRTKKIIRQYFFPSTKDIEQFGDRFITKSTHESQVKALENSCRLLRKKLDETFVHLQRFQSNPQVIQETKELISALKESLDYDPHAYKAQNAVLRATNRNLESQINGLFKVIKEQERICSHERAEKLGLKVESLHWKRYCMKFDPSITLESYEIKLLDEQKAKGISPKNTPESGQNTEFHSMDSIRQFLPQNSA